MPSAALSIDAGRDARETETMRAVSLWVDGASNGTSDSEGGWAALIVPQDEGTQLAISGYEPSTTNNRMELMAVIKGLEALGGQRASVTVYTDSAYVKNPHVRGWTRRWQQNGWKTAEGGKVANQDLWERLIELARFHLVKWRKVKGHSTYALNNLVDEMAVLAKKTRAGETRIL